MNRKWRYMMNNTWTKKWMLQPVRLCKSGCIFGRVAPAFFIKE